ncbi:hypothetical protein ACFPYL_02740 [Nocardioides hankookensis]|uniref:Uncharacterized protein n=1 Tax=Nocardioides hankookensis TaxID=443157 RepID=A0ABW1LFI2_9ACTN
MTDATTTSQTQAAAQPAPEPRDAATIHPIALDGHTYVVRWRGKVEG